METRFRILGPIQVEHAAAPVPVTARRERVLLTMLLLRVGQRVPTQRLVDAVWADRPPGSARSQIQGSIHRLRRRLAAAGMAEPVVTESGGYRLRADPQCVDLWQFRRLAGAARTAAAGGWPAEAARLFRAALDLWRGQALAGIDSAEIERAAAGLDEERQQARQDCLEVELALGRGAELVGELTALVRQHPYQERLHGYLIRALYHAGRQADALAAYRQLRRLLHDELGTEPGAELQRLHRAVLHRDPALDPPVDPPVAAPGAPDPGGAPVPRELPAEVAGFTGRTGPLKALDEALASPAGGFPRPVTISAITGPAGVGKTALAIHWAHQVADRFPDGQQYLDLRGFSGREPLHPFEALTQLLRSLGTPAERIPADESRAAALYRSTLAGRRVLIVLDNARSSDQVRPLLPGSRGCAVVVTGRDRLTGLVAQEGVRLVPLDVLSAREAQLLLVRLLGTERVDAERGAADELARACAYLPLAVRIAAADIAGRPGATIAGYLDRLAAGDRLAVLQADDDPAASVPATLALSYRALPAPEARLFRLLGLVPGPGFTAAAAASLAATPVPEVTRRLQRLVRGHLVAEPAPGRYSFHDLLRLYSRQLATAEEGPSGVDAATGRLFGYYLHRADASATLLYAGMTRLPIPPADPALPPLEFDDPAGALAWLEAELSNLVSAGVAAAGADEHRPTAWLLADSLRGYFWRSRQVADWSTMATAAAAAAEEAGDHRVRAATERGLADLHQVAGHTRPAIDRYANAADQARLAGWSDGEAAAIVNLGILLYQTGQLTGAADCFARALVIDQRDGRVAGQAADSSNLGEVNHQLGRLAAAARALTDALVLLRQLGSLPAEADAHCNLGEVEHERGRLDRAVAELTGALELHRRIGSAVGATHDLACLATVHRDTGDLARAREHAEAALAAAAELDDLRLVAKAYNTSASVELCLGNVELAVDRHQRALESARQAEARGSEISALLGITSCQLAGTGPVDDSAALLALDLARQLGYRVREGQALTVLAEVSFRLGSSDAAREYAGQALACHRETGHRLGEARTLAILGSRTGGDAYHRQAADLYRAISAPMPAGPV